MARSSLQSHSKPSHNNLGRFMSGSPQSTLCRCCKDSSHGSPNGVCYNDSSSRTTWELLHAAAGEVERMRLNQQSFHNLNTNPNEFFVPQRKSEMGSFYQQSLSHQQLQFAQFQLLKQQQMAKQNEMLWGVQKQNGGVFNGVDGRNTKGLTLSSSAWPTLQNAKQQQFQNHRYGSEMRAVFLGNGSGRRESTGTGVFLPRIDNHVQSRKKPACSTALIPARVEQALKLKLQQQHLHRFNSTPNVENVAAATHRQRGSYVISQQKRSGSRPQPAGSNEIMLPQEWTY